MKHETILNDEEDRIVSELVYNGRFGDCHQDKYLIQLCKIIRCEPGSHYGMVMPNIVNDNMSYSRSGNHRLITDISHFSGITDISQYTRKNLKDIWDIFAYFDYPVTSSALYLATFNRRLLYPLLDVVNIIGAGYNSTSAYNTPITIKVNMNSFKDISDKFAKGTTAYTPINKRNIEPSSLRPGIAKRTLKYSSEKLLGPEELFDVIENNTI